MVLLDMATSAIPLGKARIAKNKGLPVPPGCLLDVIIIIILLILFIYLLLVLRPRKAALHTTCRIAPCFLY